MTRPIRSTLRHTTPARPEDPGFDRQVLSIQGSTPACLCCCQLGDAKPGTRARHIVHAERMEELDRAHSSRSNTMGSTESARPGSPTQKYRDREEPGESRDV